MPQHAPMVEEVAASETSTLATSDELQRQLRLYEAVVQEQREIVCRFKPDTSITFVNEAYCRYIGKTREELIGTPFIDLVPESEREGVLKSLSELKPNETNVYERIDYTYDGRTVWLHWHRTALADDEGRIFEIQSVGRDITDIKMAEEEVRDERAKFQAVLDDQEEPIVRFTPEGVRTFVNQAYCRLRNESRDKLLGGNIYSWHSSRFSNELRRSLETIGPGDTITVEINDDSITGGGRWMQWSTRGFGGVDGTVTEYQAVGRDITEARRHRKALEALNRVASDAKLSSNERIAVLLAFGRDHFGLETGILSRIDGDDFIVIQASSDDDRPAPGERFELGRTCCALVFRTGRAQGIDRSGGLQIRRHPCFGSRELQAYMGARIDVGGTPWGTLSFASKEASDRTFGNDDYEVMKLLTHWVEFQITMDMQAANLRAEVERRGDAEQSLAKKVASLRQVNEELEKFAFVASHDLQEPLRQIESATSFAIEDYEAVLDDEGRRLLHIASRGAQRMRMLVTDLLQFARVGTAEPEISNLPLDRALDEALDNLSAAISDSAAVVERGELPVLACETSYLRQVFQNLIGNAIKYRSEKPPLIEISAEESDDTWVLSVADNGIGIDAKFATRIFEVFQRLHSKHEYSGTGIGLALCKRIVERQGGEIWLDTSYEGGSRFVFTLPKIPPDDLGAPSASG